MSSSIPLISKHNNAMSDEDEDDVHAESGVMLVDDDIPEFAPAVATDDDDAEDHDDVELAALAITSSHHVSSPQLPDHDNDDSMTDMDIPDIVSDNHVHVDEKPNPLEMSSAPLFLLSKNEKSQQKSDSKKKEQSVEMSSHPLFSAAVTNKDIRKDVRENILGFSEGESVILLIQPEGHEKFDQHTVMRILYRPHMPNVTSGYVVAIKSDTDGKLRWRDSDHMLPVISK